MDHSLVGLAQEEIEVRNKPAGYVVCAYGDQDLCRVVYVSLVLSKTDRIAAVSGNQGACNVISVTVRQMLSWLYASKDDAYHV